MLQIPAITNVALRRATFFVGFQKFSWSRITSKATRRGCFYWVFEFPRNTLQLDIQVIFFLHSTLQSHFLSVSYVGFTVSPFTWMFGGKCFVTFLKCELNKHHQPQISHEQFNISMLWSITNPHSTCCMACMRACTQDGLVIWTYLLWIELNMIRFLVGVCRAAGGGRKTFFAPIYIEVCFWIWNSPATENC